MCGITGVFFRDGRACERPLLEKMNAVMRHRGPDADGFYQHRHVGLAMRRLKVIDLETGNQPIHDGQRRFWIVFNGEIYNYRALRAELEARGHRFYTHSDTEVIVHLYREAGEKCLDRLIGMFAFAIYDTAEGSLFLARDRLGIKPLFYHSSPAAFVFGSELKAVLEAPWIARKPDPAAVSHYLSLNYLPSPWTPVEGVRQLPPGHWMRVANNGVTIRQYWDIPFGETCGDSEAEACEKITGLLHRSMERRLIADVPIGAFLSGGLDSSTLVYLMKEQRQGVIKTFSVGFDEPGYDETVHARRIARYFGTEHYEIRCSPGDVTGYLEKIAWHADNLLADQAALPLYLVSKLAKEHVTVCLSGDGGDETFIGYPTFHADALHAAYAKIPRWLRRGVIEKAVRALPASTAKISFEYRAKKFAEAGDFAAGKAHYWWRTIFTDDEKRKLLRPEVLAGAGGPDSYGLYGEYLDRAAAAGPVNRCLYADLKVWLAGNNLAKVDSVSMAHGLEARVPFLDHELVEYMARLPVRLKFRGMKLKYLLKKIMAGKLPDSILHRKKSGFHIPIAGWLKGPLEGYVRSVLLEDGRGLDSILDPAEVKKVIDDHCAGRMNNTFKLWGLMILTKWHERFIGGR